ncbi:CPBP family intramembrane glutamic endopeptidase [Cellulosimicrobium cellulans]|uniref:CPBP family intramembrane glutamic endopeptidase n=1 Tax=Cellulosimicrobium cellulans TaxID=1710 RepID=UPI0036EF1A38
MTATSPAGLRVRPRVWIGLAVWVGYLVLVYVVQVASGVPYDTWGDSARNLFVGAGVSLIVATVLLAVTTSLLGWWRPALFEISPSRHRWLVFVPALTTVAALMNLIGTDWSAYSGAFFAASLTLALVGFTEELVNRGLLLVGLRSRLGEGWVWFLTSAMFGLSHLVNIALGADDVATAQQVVSAFLAGTVFYILRRTTGSLVWAMILHGLWDFSVFAAGVGTPSDIVYIANVLEPAAGVIGLALVALVIRDARTAPSRTDVGVSPSR